MKKSLASMLLILSTTVAFAQKHQPTCSDYDGVGFTAAQQQKLCDAALGVTTGYVSANRFSDRQNYHYAIDLSFYTSPPRTLQYVIVLSNSGSAAVLLENDVGKQATVSGISGKCSLFLTARTGDVFVTNGVTFIPPTTTTLHASKECEEFRYFIIYKGR